MKRKEYLQPAIEVVEALPTVLLSGSLMEEGETDEIGVFDDEDPDLIIGL